MSFLPETDVNRVIGYAIQQGKRSFAALIPDNAYGTVVQAAFQQAVARGGGRVDRDGALSARPRADAGAGAARRAGGAAGRYDLHSGRRRRRDGGRADAHRRRRNTRRIQLIGTGLWDDPRIFAEAGAQGGWFAAPDPAGYRAFSGRYRQRYGQDPLRPATLAYDAVSLVAALVKTQGPARFSEEVLTNQSGFAGIDGVFRFRPDGTNQRGLAVMRVTTSGPQVISPAPKAFGASGT